MMCCEYGPRGLSYGAHESPFLQALDQSIKACQGQTFWLILPQRQINEGRGKESLKDRDLLLRGRGDGFKDRRFSLVFCLRLFFVLNSGLLQNLVDLQPLLLSFLQLVVGVDEDDDVFSGAPVLRRLGRFRRFRRLGRSRRVAAERRRVVFGQNFVNDRGSIVDSVLLFIRVVLASKL